MPDGLPYLPGGVLVNFDPIITPVESSTLAPESLQAASDLAERISVSLRSLAVGLHSGSVGLDAVVRELHRLWYDAAGLEDNLYALESDGDDQLPAERGVIRHALDRGTE